MTSTDWNRYYRNPYRFARITRRITTRHLLGAMARHGVAAGNPRIGELGGGNSSFYEAIRDRLAPREYHVFDNNPLGLEKLRERSDGEPVVLVLEDILDRKQRDLNLDVVFSVGFIEHFSERDTARAIQAHFDLLKPGGLAVISYPTPTVPYRIARSISEAFGMWIFHDERPLRRKEVEATTERNGMILEARIIWAIVLTQEMIVVRKHLSRGSRTGLR